MRSLSRPIGSMPRSGIREIFDRASRIPNAIHLEMGEPDFSTPEHIRDAAAAALAAGYTRYTPNAGLPELRRAAADKLRRVNGIELPPEQVVVTIGGVGGLYSSLLALCNPGDEVILLGPAWPNYRMIATLLDLSIVQLPMPDDRDPSRLTEMLDEVRNDATQVLLINSPTNPTGAMLSADELAALVAWVDANDVWLLSDEVYDEMTFDRPSVSPFPMSERSSVVSVFSMSKTYAMTGWRVGYVAVPQSVGAMVEKTLEPTVSCANAAAQMAAVAALDGPQDCVAAMRDAYRARRDMATGLLEAAGVGHRRPDGAFYLWVDVSSSGLDSVAFAKELLERHEVALTPGVAFGAAYDDRVRISLATAEPLLRSGVERMIDLLATG